MIENISNLVTGEKVENRELYLLWKKPKKYAGIIRAKTDKGTPTLLVRGIEWKREQFDLVPPPPPLLQSAFQDSFDLISLHQELWTVKLRKKKSATFFTCHYLIFVSLIGLLVSSKFEWEDFFDICTTIVFFYKDGTGNLYKSNIFSTKKGMLAQLRALRSIPSSIKIYSSPKSNFQSTKVWLTWCFLS